MAAPMRRSVVILGTGGTIAGLAPHAHDNVAYVAAQVGIAELAKAVRVPLSFAFELCTEQVSQVDSKDMAFEVWDRLATRCSALLSEPEVQGVVVAHGTDTLEETAFFLHLVLAARGQSGKPVVLTGAMRPASSMVADGPQNLCDALAVAAHPESAGVVAVFAGTVHAASDVQKVHSYRLDAFSCGEAGPLAYVEEGKVRVVRSLPAEKPVEGGFLQCLADFPWPRVEIVMNYAGASGFIVDSLLAHGAPDGDRLRGLVVAGTGNGTVHKDLDAALLRAQEAGVRIVRATRCASGHVLAGTNDAFPDSGGLSPVKARIALMLQLMQPRAVAA